MRLKHALQNHPGLSISTSTGRYDNVRDEHVSDFFDFISGDRKNNPGFQYELIYSDPPAKPEAK